MDTNLSNTCRCCLNSTEISILNMSEHLLFDKTGRLDANPTIIESYLGLCVDSSLVSMGPMNICSHCRLALQNCVNFRDLCRANNDKFQNLWIKKEIINLEEPDKPALNIICNNIIGDKFSVSEVLIADVKSEPDSDDDDDVPLAGRRQKDKSLTTSKISIEDDLESEPENSKRKRRQKQKKVSRKRRKTQHSSDEDLEEDDDEDNNAALSKSDLESDADDDWQLDGIDCEDSEGHDDSISGKQLDSIESTFFCLFCEKDYSNYKSMARHRRSHEPKTDKTRFKRDCNLCAAKEVDNYEKHLAAEHPEFKPNKCTQCGDCFQDYLALKSHLLMHLTGNKYQCLGCKTYHPSEFALRRHIIIASHNTSKVNGKRRKVSFNCHVCGMECEKVSEIQDHVAKSHPKDDAKKYFPCFHCKKVFSSLSGYKLDYRKTCSQRKAEYESKKKRLNQVKRFECQSCDKKFYEDEDLLCHTISFHRSTFKSCYCTECKINYNTMGEYRQHMKRSHSETYKQIKNKRNFMCAVCGKCCNTKGRLQQHAVCHVNDRPCKCDKCPASFKHKSNLRSHMKLHTVERNIECNECGKFFTSLHYVKVHLSRCHFPSIRRFKCDVCPRTMTTVTEKKRHQRTHTGERPFKCNICERSYATEAGLTGHVQTNHTSIRYECKFCDKKLALKISMWKHIFSHRGFYPFNCPACNYGCFPKELIKRHMLKHHNLEYDEEIHGYHAETFDEVIASGIKVTAENAPNFRANQINLNNEINYLNYVAMETIEKEMHPKVEGQGHQLQAENFMPPMHPPQAQIVEGNFNSIIQHAPPVISSYEAKAKYLHPN